MRVMLCLDRYLPSPLSSATMFYELATEMARLGNEVTVVAGDDSLPKKCEVVKEDDLTIVRVKAGKIRHKSKIVRTINETRLSGIIWNSGYDYFKNNPCDLVICYSPTIFWSKLVSNLKKLHNCSSYLVLRDLFPQWALDTGLISRYGLPYRYFKYEELKLYQSADIIGVQSPANLEYFTSSNLSKRYNLEVLFNWTKIEEYANPSNSLRSRLNLKDQVIFMYGGNLGWAQDMDNILRLASKLKNEENIVFLLVGDGSEYDRIRQEIDQDKLSNIKLLPAVSHIEYLKILGDCDVGLITLRRDFKTQNLPGKMLSYMNLQKPMLASINPGNDLKDIVHEYNAGFVCENGDDDEFCQYALKLAHDRGLRLKVGMNGYKLLNDKFNVSSAAKQILAHFTSDC